MLVTIGRSFGPAGYQCRALATVPSRGPDPLFTGRCTVDSGNDAVVKRFVPLSSSIHLANSSTDELLAEFIRFFCAERHTRVAPSSVYPKRHEGSYFINAGMNQFKPLFLATDESPTRTTSAFDRLSRAVNCQPCIRVGGRHDDLNDVGYDGQHHTMFEMLGNWSFGDYYKTEACRLMWKFVREVLNLPANALYITYFGGCPQLGLPADDETRNIWLSLGISDQKLLPFGVEHNFWRAGHSSGGGLCGPATEIHVDFAALSGEDNLRCARCLVNASSPHVVELWNCVFISYRVRPQSGPAGSAGQEDLLEPLPRHFVDTGMGLERLASVMQGATTTYDSDRFKSLLDYVHAECTTSEYSPPRYAGQFLPTISQLTRYPLPTSPDEVKDTSEPTEAEDLLSTALAEGRGRNQGRLATLWHRLGLIWRQSSFTGPRPEANSRLPTNAVLQGGDLSARDQLLVDWHRDTAYRLLVDHGRALAVTLSDGLLPGRQGLGLKLRQLIQRATRASMLGGLEISCSRSRWSMLASLVSHLAVEHRERVERRLSGVHPDLVCGPNAQVVSPLSPSEIGDIVDREVKSFLPRVDALESAFHRCLEEPAEDNIYRLSDSQVTGLMTGRYGTEVSWDLICAQSQWAGLALPSQPPRTPPPTGRHGNGAGSTTKMTTRAKGDGDNASGNSLLSHLSDLLRLGKVPYSDDSRKYSVTRRDPGLSGGFGDRWELYDFPDCQSHIVSVLLPETKKSVGKPEAYRLVSRGQWPAELLPDLESLKDSRLGLVFAVTNFFSPSGGQDGDLGWIKCPFQGNRSVTLRVDRVEFIPSSTALTLADTRSLGSGWVVHWVTLKEEGDWRFAVPLSQAWRGSSDPPTCQLIVDKRRRFDLMCHHTGQHLFTWALSTVSKNLVAPSPDDLAQVPDGVKAGAHKGRRRTGGSVQHHGGAVHSDKFVLHASLPGLVSDWLQKNLVDFVQRVEDRCRQAIRADLPVSALNLTWEQVAKNPCVRRFAWNEYADRVTAVCIGGCLPHEDNHHIDGVSAELCSGTHVASTGDLQDVAVLSIRSRRQSVKQFTVLAGEAAVAARLRGDQLMSQLIGEDSPTSTIDRLAVPLVAREQVACGALSVRQEDDADWAKNRALLTEEISKGLQVVEPGRLLTLMSTTVWKMSQLELPIASLLDLSPSNSVIVHSGPLALCYFPLPPGTTSTLDTAHVLATRLSTSLADRALPVLVKARPARADNLDQSNRYRFAVLQLLSTSPTSEASDWSRLPQRLLHRTAVSVLDQLCR